MPKTVGPAAGQESAREGSCSGLSAGRPRTTKFVTQGGTGRQNSTERARRASTTRDKKICVRGATVHVDRKAEGDSRKIGVLKDTALTETSVAQATGRVSDFQTSAFV